MATIPGSSFYLNPRDGSSLIRFCFSKRDETIREAERRLEKLQPAVVRLRARPSANAVDDHAVLLDDELEVGMGAERRERLGAERGFERGAVQDDVAHADRPKLCDRLRRRGMTAAAAARWKKLSGAKLL